MRISRILTPSKRLMRERSSPGVRRHSFASAFESSGDGSKEPIALRKEFDPEFNEVYKSVERIGGIGSARSALNIDNHKRAGSAASTRSQRSGTNQAQSSLKIRQDDEKAKGAEGVQANQAPAPHNSALSGPEEEY